MDFLTSIKKEGSIKTIYIDDQLCSKSILKGDKWLPICIKEGCEKFPEKNDLCKKHSKEQLYIDEGTIIKRGDIDYTWNSGKWSIKCDYLTCTNHALKTGYCKDHNSLKNTGTTIGSTMDIFNMIKFD